MEKATLKNNDSGESTGSSVTQNKSIPCELDGPAYTIGIKLEDIEGDLIQEYSFGYPTIGKANRALRQARHALTDEILMMFIMDDVRNMMDEIGLAFEDDGKELTRVHTEDDVRVVARELYWDNSIENANSMIGDTIIDWMNDNLVKYDE